jgi:hypothetical protein
MIKLHRGQSLVAFHLAACATNVCEARHLEDDLRATFGTPRRNNRGISAAQPSSCSAIGRTRMSAVLFPDIERNFAPQDFAQMPATFVVKKLAGVG